MLTIRQIEIVKTLLGNKDVFLSANTIATKLNVSLRTVQSDLHFVKEEFMKQDFLKLISVPSKGLKLVILNEISATSYFDQMLKLNGNFNLNTREGRALKIISILLSSQTPINAQHLAERLFISKSTLATDLSVVEGILSKYELKIEVITNRGMQIKGTESNIRKCMVKENVDVLFYLQELMPKGNISKSLAVINQIVVDVLIDFQYHISDIVLQNFIIHIDIMIHRMESGFFLEDVFDVELQDAFNKEKMIAEAIMKRCSKIYNIPIVETEINRVAIYLKGKADYTDSSYITQDIDDFVLASLNYVKQKFGIDLSDNVQLRISLSLHLMPLLIRLEYKMQMKNELLEEIRNSYPLAFDIAYLFALEIQGKFDYTLIEDEIAYFAIYFNSALTIYNQNKGTKKVLIISSLKRSETLLLRERMNSWFSEVMLVLTIVSQYEMNDLNSEDYDVICTTEKNQFYDDGTAFLISQFPSESDYRNLKMLLDGFNGKKEILSLFDSTMFLSLNSGYKIRVIEQLSEMIAKEEQDVSILDSVNKREEMGGTYFGNFVAMPHPIHPITSKSYIAVAISKNGIKWDSYDNIVKLVLFVSIEKENPQAFQIWSYLSEIIKNEKLINTIVSNPTYENFIYQISIGLDKK